MARQFRSCLWIVCGAAALAATTALRAQLPAPAPTPFDPAKVPAGMPEPKMWTAQQDHQDMMDRLGIKALRPGPSGNEQAPNHANYDEEVANPYPDLPDVLTLKSGKKVTTPAMWTERRKEILEDFDREVLGRVPASVPTVTWTVTRTVESAVGGVPVIGRQLTGHVDNSAYPAIDVDIRMNVVTPRNAPGRVPVMIMFGFARGLPGDPPPAPFWRPRRRSLCSGCSAPGISDDPTTITRRRCPP